MFEQSSPQIGSFPTPNYRGTIKKHAKSLVSNLDFPIIFHGFPYGLSHRFGPCLVCFFFTSPGTSNVVRKKVAKER